MFVKGNDDEEEEDADEGNDDDGTWEWPEIDSI